MGKLQQTVLERDLSAGDGLVRTPDRLVVHGSVGPGVRIEAGGDVFIHGSVQDATVKSTGGGIYIDRDAYGKRTSLQAFGDVYAGSLHEVTVDCLGSVVVRDTVCQSRVNAKGFVEVKDGDGVIESSYVETGLEISTRSIGAKERDAQPTRLVLKTLRRKELFEVSLIYRQRLEQKLARIAELDKVIKVIRILGDQVTSLSPEKKRDLALKVQEYNELKKHAEQITRERDTVLSNRNETNQFLRAVMATDEVYPGVSVKIDNAAVEVSRLYHNVIFYKSGIVIIGDLDLFMQRKRLND